MLLVCLLRQWCQSPPAPSSVLTQHSAIMLHDPVASLASAASASEVHKVGAQALALAFQRQPAFHRVH